MKSSSFYFIISALCSVGISLILEKKLSHINSTTIVVCYGMFMTLSTLMIRQVIKTNDPSYDFPTGTLVIWFIILGLLYVIGDLSHAKAFNDQGTAEFGLAIFALAPVVVSLIKYFFYKEHPTPIQIVGYILFFIGISLVMTNKVPD